MKVSSLRNKFFANFFILFVGLFQLQVLFFLRVNTNQLGLSLFKQGVLFFNKEGISVINAHKNYSYLF